MVRLGLAAFTLCLSLTVQGALIYNNGSPDQVSGTNMSEVLVAENFTLSAAADITNEYSGRANFLHWQRLLGDLQRRFE
jgi:hypothetical protein